MNRRIFFKYLAAITSGSFVFSWQSVIEASEKNHLQWGYIGKAAPENWANLDSKYAVCGSGLTQSPINLKSPITEDLPSISFNYQESALHIVNNGRSIQVNYAPGSTILFGGTTYELQQFHFHHPCEHKIDSQEFDMEVHLVHYNKSGSLVVVAVLMELGKENLALTPIFKELPQLGRKKNLSLTINAKNLLPTKNNYYYYKGSLTTPPSSEIVNWLIFEQPIKISAQQIEQFAKIIGNNARPIQALNNRLVLKSL
ncbi:MAG: carbonic anhydrase family protein [Xenococcaceae cyanobacterium MO_188.B19]|nr:carbonic anhydrase family protein [Xenococcaceae cyanobacterium MO_188.B19]